MPTTNPYNPERAAASWTPSTDPMTTAAMAPTAGAAFAGAPMRDVDSNQLVQSQILSILDGDNPYIKQAERKAMEYANSRGVLNSSIAANAGRAAAYDAALPIAQQDAGVYETRSRDNQQSALQTSLKNAELGTQASLKNAELQNQLLSDRLQHGYGMEALGAEWGFRGGLSAQEAAQARQLSAQEAGQTSALSAQEFGQTGQLSAQEAAQASRLSAQEFGQTGQLSAQEAAQAATLSAQEAQQSIIRDRQNLINDLERMVEQAQDEQELTMLQSQIQTARDELLHVQQLDVMDREGQIKIDFMERDADIKVRLAEIDQRYAMELETLKNEYNLLENQQTVIGAVYNDAMKSIATILDDPDMSGDAAAARTNVIINNLASSLDFLNGVSGDASARTYGNNPVGGTPPEDTGDGGGTQPQTPESEVALQKILQWSGTSGTSSGPMTINYSNGNNVGTYRPWAANYPGQQEVITELMAAGAQYVGANLYQLPDGSQVRLVDNSPDPDEYLQGG